MHTRVGLGDPDRREADATRPWLGAPRHQFPSPGWRGSAVPPMFTVGQGMGILIVEGRTGRPRERGAREMKDLLGAMRSGDYGDAIPAALGLGAHADDPLADAHGCEAPGCGEECPNKACPRNDYYDPFAGEAAAHHASKEMTDHPLAEALREFAAFERAGERYEGGDK